MKAQFDRWAVAGAIWGPAIFVATWVVGGLLAKGYSPVDDQISRLAAVDAPTRALMTAGFSAYGVGIGIAAWPLRRIIGVPAAVSIGVSASSTVGVMMTPLGRSAGTDLVHGFFALVGYASLGLAGPLAAIALRRGHRIWATASLGVGMLTLLALVASLGSMAPGLLQRIGLTTSDAWLMSVGIAGITGRLRGDKSR